MHHLASSASIYGLESGSVFPALPATIPSSYLWAIGKGLLKSALQSTQDLCVRGGRRTVRRGRESFMTEEDRQETKQKTVPIGKAGGIATPVLICINIVGHLHTLHTCRFGESFGWQEGLVVMASPRAPHVVIRQLRPGLRKTATQYAGTGRPTDLNAAPSCATHDDRDGKHNPNPHRRSPPLQPV